MSERAVGIWPSHNGDVVLGRPGGITIGGKLSGAELWAGPGPLKSYLASKHGKQSSGYLVCAQLLLLRINRQLHQYKDMRCDQSFQPFP